MEKTRGYLEMFGELEIMLKQITGFDAISLTGAQAGIRTDTIHSRARIVSVDPSRVHRELAGGEPLRGDASAG